MSLNSPILSRIAARYEKVRAGLDVGFTDEGVIRDLHAVRGGIWRSIGAVADFPFEDGQFDIVVLNGALVTRELVREANRVLKPDGCLFFTVAEKTRGSEGFSAPEVYRLIREGFDIVDLHRSSSWFFLPRRKPTMTICARKKAWKQHNDFARKGALPFSFACLAVVLLTLGAGAADRNSNAIIRLLNSRAAGSIKSYTEAAEIVAEDARKGRPLQQFVIGLVAGDPLLPPSTRVDEETRKSYLDQSRDKIRLLAESKGNALAWYLLSIENNDMKYLQRAVDGENVQALNAMGTIRLTETLADATLEPEETVKRLGECFELFRKASAQDDVNGTFNLGMCYLNAYGCEQDQERAFNCFRKAAEQGHPQAINNIGGFYRDGIVVEPNLTIAAKWFARSSELGDVYGKFNWAMAQLRGEGVEKNDEEGIRLLKEAAEEGSVEAMNAYGMCHYVGEGVRKNPRTALMWYRRSAAYGFSPAMDNISVCYDLGVGVDKDPQKAALWKVRARAARGDRNAAAWLLQNNHDLIER